MTKQLLALMCGAMLLTACGEAPAAEEDAVEETERKEDTEGDKADIARPGTPEFDDWYYLFGANELEAYDGEMLEEFAGLYSGVADDGDIQVKTFGEIREDGRYTLYHIPVIAADNDSHQSHQRAGYYLDENVEINRREGLLIPWGDSVRIQSGYIAQAYGEFRLVLINDKSFEPSMNAEGNYVFNSLYTPLGGTDNEITDDFVGEELELLDGGGVSYGEDMLLESSDMSAFSNLIGLDEVRSASLVSRHLTEDAGERRRLREDADRFEDARYLFEPQEFALDFRFADVITETEDYNQYQRDNSLLEMEYVFEFKDEVGNVLSLYGYTDHTLFEMDADDRWQPL